MDGARRAEAGVAPLSGNRCRSFAVARLVHLSALPGAPKPAVDMPSGWKSSDFIMSSHDFPVDFSYMAAARMKFQFW